MSVQPSESQTGGTSGSSSGQLLNTDSFVSGSVHASRAYVDAKISSEASRRSSSDDALSAAVQGVDTKLTTHTGNRNVHVTQQEKASWNAKCPLENGKVPSSALPSFVDDVVESETRERFPIGGESGKIYVAKDTNKTYRWSGSAYVEISPSLALGETSSTAFPGNRGVQNEQAISGETSRAVNAENQLDQKIDDLTPGDIGAAAESHEHTKSQIIDFPQAMTPTAHAASHKTYGTDEIKPADIGAAAAVHAHDSISDSTHKLKADGTIETSSADVFKFGNSGPFSGKTMLYESSSDAWWLHNEGGLYAVRLKYVVSQWQLDAKTSESGSWSSMGTNGSSEGATTLEFSAGTLTRQSGTTTKTFATTNQIPDVSGKQDALSSDQLAVVNGGPYLPTSGGNVGSLNVVGGEDGYGGTLIICHGMGGSGSITVEGGGSGGGGSIVVGASGAKGGSILVKASGADEKGSITVEGENASIKKGGKEVATEDQLPYQIKSLVSEGGDFYLYDRTVNSSTNGGNFIFPSKVGTESRDFSLVISAQETEPSVSFPTTGVIYISEQSASDLWSAEAGKVNEWYFHENGENQFAVYHRSFSTVTQGS